MAVDHLKKVYSRRDRGRYVNLFLPANNFLQCVNTTLESIDSSILGGIVCERHLNSVSEVNKIENIDIYILTKNLVPSESQPLDVGTIQANIAVILWNNYYTSGKLTAPGSNENPISRAQVQR